MGDENEIKRLIRKKSESFLKHALFQARGGEGVYELEVEFAKTRKNKSVVVLAVTAAAILCLTGAAFAVTKVIETKAAATTVNVSAFQDLNLMDILDASKQDEAALERAKTGLAQLGADLNSELEFADRDYRASQISIRALGLSATDEAYRIAQAVVARDAAKAGLQAGYALAAAASRAELARIQQRIDRYDSRSLAKAKSERAILENERVAYDLEREQQAELYETRIGVIVAANKRELDALERQKDELAAALTSRYNPTFAGPRAAALLAARAKPSALAPPPFDPYLSVAGVLDPNAEAALDASLSDLEYLSGEMRSVPYLNSAPSALARIESEARLSIGAYRAALQAAASGLAARDRSIAALERYRSALVSLARDSGDSGYVIDARDPARLLVLFDPAAGAREGDRGFVVREGKVVAAASFAFAGGDAFALVAKSEAGQTPRAFDSIVLIAPRKAAQ